MRRTTEGTRKASHCYAIDMHCNALGWKGLLGHNDQGERSRRRLTINRSLPCKEKYARAHFTHFVADRVSS